MRRIDYGVDSGIDFRSNLYVRDLQVDYVEPENGQQYRERGRIGHRTDNDGWCENFSAFRLGDGREGNNFDDLKVGGNG